MSEQKEQREGREKKRLLIIVLMLCCIIVLLFSGYQVIKILAAYHEAEAFYEDASATYTHPNVGNGIKEGKERPPIYVDLEELQEKNEDIIGWIYMEDTVVDYPLLQGTNNYYYLDKTYEKKYLASGSIYLDSRNESDMTDSYSIIYGHNMRNHTMFGDLDWFMEEEYLKGHPYIYILLPKGRWLKYEIFSVHRAGVEEITYEAPLKKSEFKELLKLSKEQNLFRENKSLTLPTPKSKDKVITLSTCTEDRAQMERFVLQAVLIYDSAAEQKSDDEKKDKKS
ncbi:MAG: class B sortase [Firmicutes bacterium]|nr:class B sortase [Bacillota bacterium]